MNADRSAWVIESPPRTFRGCCEREHSNWSDWDGPARATVDEAALDLAAHELDVHGGRSTREEQEQ